MLKTASRKAAGKLAPEAYLFSPAHPKLPRQLVLRVGYVEDVGEPRTTREVVFSVLLEARSPFENSIRIPA
jgi:hypothetical protein